MGKIKTSAQTAFLVSYVGSVKEINQRLGEEAVGLLPTPQTPVTVDVLNNTCYSRAVLKEIFRLRPVAFGAIRTVPEDVVLSGFQVPKYTTVIMQTAIACRQECNFPAPLQFKPERWIKDSPIYKAVHPYIILPFSVGVRNCLARRRAEQNLFVFMLNVFRGLHVAYIGEEQRINTLGLNTKPAKPVRVVFQKH